VVVISEVAKRSEKLGALIAALPLVTVLTLLWLYFEKQPSEKIANHAYYTFWYVIPTLPMLLAFPWLFARFGFWGAMGLSLVLTVVCFAVFAYGAKEIGVDLIG
jgi:F0F1-type ATP synthase assembly protein I